MSSRTSLLVVVIAALIFGVACGGGSIGNKVSSYTISANVTGVSGTLVLQDNGGDNLTVTATGTFPFTTPVTSGSSYAVTILTQPTGQTCTLGSNATGMANANVTVAVTCAATTYTISAAVSGLTGTGLVLQDNGADNLTVTADGTYPFATPIAINGTYAVTILTQPSGQTCFLGSNAIGTATANVTVTVTCMALYTISANVSGLTSGTLVLQDNGGNNLSVTANGSFPFTTQIVSGSPYAVTVLTQPSGQTCTPVAPSSGTASANTTVNVTCAATLYTISAAVSGLSGTLVLQDNGGNNLTVTTNGTFPFTTQIASGGTYAVTILTQPSGQTCVLGSGSSGTATGNVTVTVTCSATLYTISAAVSGLTGTLVLQDNGGDNLTLLTDGTFPFATKIASGGTYAVTILTQPSEQTCTLGSGSSGTVTGNVTVTVTCTASLFTIGGNVTGLTGTGLVLQDNGGDNLSISGAGNVPFTFATSLAAGSTYNVTVKTQPSGQACTVTNGTGTANANVTNVTVTCAATYTIGGTVTGLTGTGLVLQDNGTDNLTITGTGTVPFTFATALQGGSTYNVTVKTQPTGQNCVVTNGSGTANANVTNVTVTCTATAMFSIGGTVSGLTGTGLVLQDNGGDNLSISGNGSFTFATKLLAGSAYNVTVLTQPTGEVCSVTNGSGTANGNVTNVDVSCSSGSGFTIGGTVYDLSENASTTGVVLQDNGGDNLTVATNGSFTFATQVASGGAYAVTVLTQPTKPAQTCTVNNGTGTASGNVTNVQVVCISEWSWINGTNLVAVGGIYPTNSNGAPLEPGTRYGTSSWLDGSGNFWVFGGIGYDINGPSAGQTTGGGAETVMSDLWKFNGTTWSFQGGPNTGGVTGVYPTTIGGTGTPGGRSDAVQWIDASGNLWMFGGYAVDKAGLTADPINDIWEYTGGQWIWQGPTGSNNASQQGTYNGIGNAGTPGARYWSTGFVDASGIFWMFGGYGIDGSNNLGYLNDMWKFDPTTLTWTWVSGSSTNGKKGVYTGTTAVPGSRYGASSWIDSSGNFWLFGGDAYDSAGNVGNINDLWEFNTSTSKWTFVGGSQTINAGDSYGTQGVPDPSNTPGSRVWSTTWQTPNGDVWLFGGVYSPRDDFFNDLWKYSGGQWTWVDGSQLTNQLGIYPASAGGPPSPTNAPGSRMQGAPFADANGNLWLFGGFGLGSLPVGSGTNVHSGFDSLQDLWEFQP